MTADQPGTTAATVPADPHANDHADCSPDECFTAKVRYWRQYPPGVHIH